MWRHIQWDHYAAIMHSANHLWLEIFSKSRQFVSKSHHSFRVVQPSKADERTSSLKWNISEVCMKSCLFLWTQWTKRTWRTSLERHCALQGMQSHFILRKGAVNLLIALLWSSHCNSTNLSNWSMTHREERALKGSCQPLWTIPSWGNSLQWAWISSLSYVWEIYTVVCERGWGAQISVGSPACVLERNCDKDRKRARRPKAAH